MAITLSGNKIKYNGTYIGYYTQSIGLNKWYAEFKTAEGICVKSARTLNDLRWAVKARFED